MSVNPPSYDAYGPVGLPYDPPLQRTARADEPAAPQAPATTTATQAPASPAAVSKSPGTVEDVVAANVAAKGSADLLASPTDEYASSMSQVVSSAVANIPKVGGRLDTQM